MNFILKTKDENGKVKAKRIKVTPADIQTHIKSIDEQMRQVQEERKRYRDILKELSTLKEDEDPERYSNLINEAKLYEDADERYSQLQDQVEKEYTILKKYKDSKFYIQPKDLMIIGGVFLISVFMIALERENPKALKLASFVLKVFPIKI